MTGETDLAVFLPSLAGGGAERVMVTLCAAFSEQGYRVTLVLADKSGPYLEQVPKSVAVVGLGQTSLIRAVLPLTSFLKKARPKVLLSAMPHANMAGLVARRLARVPTRVVISERNTLSQIVETSKRPLIGLMPTAMRFIYPSADGIIAVSRGVADDLAHQIRLPRDRIQVVYNPVATPNLRDDSHAPLQDQRIASSTSPLILAAGRLTPAKDHALLLEAFARLRKERDCMLAILGEGPLAHALMDRAEQLQIAEHVLWPGFQANPFNWMRHAGVFVLSSRHEGLPGVLIQAMACGTPVVSTDCPSGPDEILEGGKWGRLVPVGDPAALADAIAATLDEQQHPDVERRAADFGVDRAVHGYASVLGLDLRRS